MKTITDEELDEILELHVKWLKGESGGKRADLSHKDLSGRDLSFANLSYANLNNAYFDNAFFKYANLSYANLNNAYFDNANLSGCAGIKYVDCSFDTHGEAGRRLLCVRINEKNIYFCGCFTGTIDELDEYIEEGLDKHKETRKIARNFCESVAKTWK